MPKYNKKITRQMSYEEFKSKIEPLPQAKRAFLSVLFFSGCRVSEALALTSDNISISKDTVYVDFFRLKGSKQTDPIPLPIVSDMGYVVSQEGKLFPWCRKTGYNIVKSVFPELYPHFFRQNRVMKSLQKFGIPATKSFFGFRLSSMEHYVTKVDIKKIGQALRQELEGTTE